MGKREENGESAGAPEGACPRCFEAFVIRGRASDPKRSWWKRLVEMFKGDDDDDGNGPCDGLPLYA